MKAGGLGGPVTNGEPTSIVLLNGHVEKMPSKCLHSSAALHLGQSSFFLERGSVKEAVHSHLTH